MSTTDLAESLFDNSALATERYIRGKCKTSSHRWGGIVPFLLAAYLAVSFQSLRGAAPSMAANDTKGRYMGTPLYMDVRDAAAYVGIGEKAMRDYVNSTDPPPYLMNGQKKMLQVAALALYFEERQEVRSGQKKKRQSQC